MGTHKSFKDVKFQWLSLLTQDSSVSTTAITVAVYIVTTHYNHEKNCAWPSFSTIAQSIGKNTKTIQRAIKELEAHWLTVKRGNGHGHSTKFTVHPQSLKRAIELREKQDKIVHFHTRKGGHFCPKRGANLSKQTGQNCPPNKVKESKKEKTKQFPRIFVELGSPQEKAWQTWQSQKSLPPLEHLFPIEKRYGAKGFYLPQTFPPREGPQSSDIEHFFNLKTLMREEVAHV